MYSSGILLVLWMSSRQDLKYISWKAEGSRSPSGSFPAVASPQWDRRGGRLTSCICMWLMFHSWRMTTSHSSRVGGFLMCEGSTFTRKGLEEAAGILAAPLLS